MTVPGTGEPEARAALRAIATDPVYGTGTLSDPRAMSSLLTDYLPGAGRERAVLVAAAGACWPARCAATCRVRDRRGRPGLPPGGRRQRGRVRWTGPPLFADPAGQYLECLTSPQLYGPVVMWVMPARRALWIAGLPDAVFGHNPGAGRLAALAALALKRAPFEGPVRGIGAGSGTISGVPALPGRCRTTSGCLPGRER